MPLSLKTMLKKFVHKGQITQDEYDALIKKLEGHDKEIRSNAIDEFVNAIEEYYFKVVDSPFMPYLKNVRVVSEANIRHIAEQLKEE